MLLKWKKFGKNIKKFYDLTKFFEIIDILVKNLVFMK